MTEDDLFDPQRFPWTKGQPLVDWVAGNTWEHYTEHLDWINQLIKDKSAAR